MTGAALLARVRLLLPALGCLLVALGALYAGSQVAELRCERAAGVCTWRTGSMLGAQERSFRIADVREVRFIDDLGKHRGDAETALIFATGRELRLARDSHASTHLRFTELREFFAPGASEPRLEQLARRARWSYLHALGFGIAAVVLAVRRWRAPTASDRVSAAEWWARNRRAALGGLVLVLLLGVLALVVPGSDTQGTLELECWTRCRFQGGECLPGGALETTLDPGTYTLEVWAESGSDLWTPRTFEIEAGATTHFTCQP